MELQLQKEMSLNMELRTAVRLIEVGLGEFQNLGGANDFLHLPLQLLASGFERLMKVHICCGHLENHGSFPNFKYLKKPGHDLLKLKNLILEEYFQTNSPALYNDKVFLENNSDFEKLLDLLSEFGKYARYHNLDIVTESVKPSRDVEGEWRQFETSLVIQSKGILKRLLQFETNKQALQETSSKIVILLEQFIRAISRQFTLGKLGKLALQNSPMLFQFIIMDDNKLGTRDYRMITTYETSRERRVHTRTRLDERERKSNPNYRHLKIKKSEYKGNWPFYVDEVIVECRYKHWTIITIDNQDFALNGAAEGKYKLENPHDAGVAIYGSDYSEFRRIALQLFE